MRQAHIVRRTNETDIDLTLTLLPPTAPERLKGRRGSDSSTTCSRRLPCTDT